MNIHHHPDDSTILANVAGTLSEGMSLVVAAHMEHCPQCQERQAQANALGGELLSELPRAQMRSGGLAQVWKLIDAGPASEPPRTPLRPARDGTPDVLQPYLHGGLDSIPWRSLVPGLRQYRLDDIGSGHGSVRLLSIAPGVTIPHHTHGGGELTLVLRGSYTDEIGRFQRGDLADLDPTVEHQPVADTDEPCICLIATDERLRFSGVFSRMLQPLIGI